MVNEIVRIRQNITEYLTIGMSETDKKLLYLNERTAYWLKYNTIKNCIFAVDIEPSAVDIAQLRLWLSLIIETEINPNAKSPMDGFSGPVPLPNLDSNILCGDSLIDQIEGTQLFRVEDIRDKRFSTLIDWLIDEQKKLFVCDDLIKKGQIKKNIQDYKDLIIAQQTGSSSLSTVKEYKIVTRKPSRPLTIWPLDFARVFKENGGFDIVVGNPPYVQLQKSISPDSSEKVGDRYSQLGYETFAKSGDMYCLFYELGLRLLSENGHLAFITSNKWLKTAYGEQLRSYFLNNSSPKILIDFSGIKVFDTVQVDVSIFITEKTRAVNPITTVCAIKNSLSDDLGSFIRSNSEKMTFKSGEKWNILPDIEEAIKKKISSVGKPIANWDITIKYGIKTCLNKVYVIDESKKNALCQKDPASAEILQPVLRGRDIKKWECGFCNLWLVAVHNGIHKYKVPPVDINKYNAVKDYLTPYMDELKKKIDQGVTPYHLKNCTYYEEFEKPKIMFQEIEQTPAFALDPDGKYMCVDTVRIITGNHLEYLTGLLNSKLFFFAVKHFYSGGTLGESGIRMKHTFFKAFSAYVPTDSEEHYIRSVVLSGKETRDKLINEFFYSKYKLTPEEIAYIEADVVE